MNTKMITILIATLAVILLAFSTPAFAVAKDNPELKHSDSIRLFAGGRLHSWRAIKRDELLIWASKSRPYLVKIWRPSTSLRFVHSLGVTSFGGRVTKFDQVIVDGQRLPIRSITALDRETAENLHWTKT